MDKELLKQNGWTIECESPLEIRHENGSFATLNAAETIIFSLKLEDIFASVTDFKVWDDVLVMSAAEIKENFGITVSNQWENFMKAREYRFYIGEITEIEGRAGFYTMIFNDQNPQGFFIELRFIKELVNRSQRNQKREIAKIKIAN